MNIALLSPSKSSYSETFIQAQKNGLRGTVFYYYDGTPPTKLEGKGSILIPFGDFRKRYGFLYKDVKSHSLKASFKKNKIDVVLAQYGPTGEAAAAICEAMHIPLIVHFHGYDAFIWDVISKHNYYQNCFKVASSVIVVSQHMKKQLIALGCPENKLIYNPCTPDDLFYEVSPNFLNQQFLVVGRFTDKKAPYYSLLAFQKILKWHPKATLVFAGQGDLLDTCKNLAKYLDIEDAVIFMGIIKREKLLLLLEGSIAFLQHSITTENGDCEGTPVAVMEASAAGLPVIASLHAGIPEVILDNETGLLVKEHDVAAMSNHMLTLLNQPDLAHQLGKRGKQRIQKYFSRNQQLKLLQETLINAINGSC